MIPSPQAQDFPLLLEVFREGLKIGLISREEIVTWADRIISTADEPDYFFIELSLSSSINRLIEVLNNYAKPIDDPICNRVLLALIYHRKPIYSVKEVEKVALMVGSMSAWDRLTFFENNTIYTFYDYYVYYSPDLTQLQVELINFLDIYEGFTLENHEQWANINEHVLQLLKEQETKINSVNESIRRTWAKKERKRKLLLYLKQVGVITLVLLFFGVFYSLPDNGSENHVSLYVILVYILFRVTYAWWRRRKS